MSDELARIGLRRSDKDRGGLKTKPLPYYQLIVINRIKVCLRDQVFRQTKVSALGIKYSVRDLICEVTNYFASAAKLRY